ncbi:MAG: hypothetical protein K0S09_778 [Sphingobacteriaceae bacterium]|jgi:hypothetical protein|nr:hypothetical protein [Sphingobacteriaceae bacterium]
MIVPSMTLYEIHKELDSDVRTLKSKIDYCHKDFKRKVLKASRYPFTHSYDCLTREKKNLFVVTLYAAKRSDREKPLINICGIYNRPEGKYAAALAIGMNLTTIHPPHFFKRYRERIVKDMKSSNDDIIRQYFFRNAWGFVAAPTDAKSEGVYNFFEAGDANISFVCVNSEGFCFGEKQGNINVMKTIISEEMLREDQKEVFAKLNENFALYNKDMFGSKYPG